MLEKIFDISWPPSVGYCLCVENMKTAGLRLHRLLMFGTDIFLCQVEVNLMEALVPWNPSLEPYLCCGTGSDKHTLHKLKHSFLKIV